MIEDSVEAILPKILESCQEKKQRSKMVWAFTLGLCPNRHCDNYHTDRAKLKEHSSQSVYGKTNKQTTSVRERHHNATDIMYATMTDWKSLCLCLLGQNSLLLRFRRCCNAACTHSHVKLSLQHRIVSQTSHFCLYARSVQCSKPETWCSKSVM